MKPTKEQMQDESKWIRSADRQPSTNGFYAVRADDSYYGIKEFWLIYDGRWTHGHYLEQDIADERAINNQLNANYIPLRQWPNMEWFQPEPDLFD